jgi:hypothetical protein
MARWSNTFSVACNHMEWKSDSLCIYFAHMKNDQTDRPRDPRHIYANSVSPEICPILAIALYWISYGFDADTGRLFPGSNQYERFRKSLKLFEGREVMLAELQRRVIEPDSIGTHYMRKGSATYCSSGSPSCPSSTSIYLRAGRSLGGVQKTYLLYESAGDMFV